MGNITRKIRIPTGYLFTGEYSKGELETLSIGDYGKRHNIKADFLGFHDDVETVRNGRTEPLSEKWVVTLSTQYGCPMRCAFCDCPKVPFGGNATVGDLKAQLYNALACFPDEHYAGRLNVHFARMGEPSLNASSVIGFSQWMATHKRDIKHDTGVSVDVLHPVFTTMCPKSLGRQGLKSVLGQWCTVKNETYAGCAGLQISVNSTSDAQRDEMFGGMAMQLEEIADVCSFLPEPLGRKYCLNFALADGYEVDADRLRELFAPTDFMVKITPIHNNDACRESGIETSHGYTDSTWYRKAEDGLKSVGFDVLVFVPSMDEEDGLVTCGNLVLSGAEVRNEVL